MTSYIVVHDQKELQLAKAQELCQTLAIDPFDMTLLSPEKETSLGIELIKKMQAKVFLKPLKSKDKAILIIDAQLLTIPAQNALLKLLEEPPDHTYIFLLTDNLDVLLPTIKSRCKIIKGEGERGELSEEEIKTIKLHLASWKDNSVPEALKQAEHMAKDKQAAILTIQQAIVVARQQLLASLSDQNISRVLFSQLHILQKALRILSFTNANPRMTLEELFLQLRCKTG